ncbi:MAG: hypothetical protein HY434_00585 [Candidatus Liptonbacteria bacterium]|nr:hypothetical protein [Parcubacteria group bacterium]MBI4087312.1 hypothetical protein [Candidatus Liptonbacteria bacterium]
MKFRYQKFIIGGHDPHKPLIARPYIPVSLLGKNRKTRSPYYALLDSGADRIIFPADLAVEIGINDITTGNLEPTVGIANQKADVFYHHLALQVMGDQRILPSEVGFSKEIYLPILGRSFFAHFKAVIFTEAKEEVELKN